MICLRDALFHLEILNCFGKYLVVSQVLGFYIVALQAKGFKEYLNYISS